MSGQYLPILALLVLASLFAAVSFVASRLLAPRRSLQMPAVGPTVRVQVAGARPPSGSGNPMPQRCARG